MSHPIMIFPPKWFVFFQGAASVVLMLIKMFLSQLTKAEKKSVRPYASYLHHIITHCLCLTPSGSAPPPGYIYCLLINHLFPPFPSPGPFLLHPTWTARTGQSVSSKDWNMSDPIIKGFEGIKGHHTVNSVQLDFFFFFLCAAVENSKVKHLSNTTYKT